MHGTIETVIAIALFSAKHYKTLYQRCLQTLRNKVFTNSIFLFRKRTNHRKRPIYRSERFMEITSFDFHQP